jgi:hypothetical protein
MSEEETHSEKITKFIKRKEENERKKMSASRTTKKELLSLVARIATAYELHPILPSELYDDIISTLEEVENE